LIVSLLMATPISVGRFAYECVAGLPAAGVVVISLELV
jgi:hypothetical protein